MKQTEIKDIVKKHKLWLEGSPDGVQANLEGVDLSYMNLRGVDLRKANLRKAYLVGACLRGTNLSEANLRNAHLREANLYKANLNKACLQNVDLTDAILRKASLEDAFLTFANFRYANLCYTNLKSADLKHANLSGASLIRADLSGANLIGTVMYEVNLTEACLDKVVGKMIEFRKGKILTKSLIGYKKCRYNVIVTLEIPEGATVFSINGEKCRTNMAKVVAVDGADEGLSFYDDSSYRVGDEVIINDFNCEYNEECTTGIHFFINRKDAEQY